MQKILLGVAAGVGVAAFTLAPPAQAACWWNGYGYLCNSAPVYGYGYGPGQFNNPATYGYVPRGLAHPNGAQTGGGGCYQGQAKNGCGDE